jgi:hypothetical protein
VHTEVLPLGLLWLPQTWIKVGLQGEVCSWEVGGQISRSPGSENTLNFLPKACHMLQPFLSQLWLLVSRTVLWDLPEAAMQRREVQEYG